MNDSQGALQVTGEALSLSFLGITDLLSFVLHDYIPKSLKALDFDQLKHNFMFCFIWRVLNYHIYRDSVFLIL